MISYIISNKSRALYYDSAVLEQQVVQCGIEMKVDQSSDHLPIHTEFEWELTYKASESKS